MKLYFFGSSGTMAILLLLFIQCCTCTNDTNMEGNNTHQSNDVAVLMEKHKDNMVDGLLEYHSNAEKTISNTDPDTRAPLETSIDSISQNNRVKSRIYKWLKLCKQQMYRAWPNLNLGLQIIYVVVYPALANKPEILFPFFANNAIVFDLQHLSTFDKRFEKFIQDSKTSKFEWFPKFVETNNGTLCVILHKLFDDDRVRAEEKIITDFLKTRLASLHYVNHDHKEEATKETFELFFPKNCFTNWVFLTVPGANVYNKTAPVLMLMLIDWILIIILNFIGYNDGE